METLKQIVSLSTLDLSNWRKKLTSVKHEFDISHIKYSMKEKM